MGDKRKELLKEACGHSCDISFVNMPTSHAVSLALLFMYACCGFCHVLAYAITANNVCLGFLVFLHLLFFVQLHEPLWLCINEWRSVKREKHPLKYGIISNNLYKIKHFNFNCTN